MKQLHEFLKDKRIERGITLRQFCKEIGVDPSNWSKIERGISPATKSKEFREILAKVLSLSKDETDTLNDLCLIDYIPNELRPSEEILEKLPVFFRTGRGEKASKAELVELFKLLSKS